MQAPSTCDQITAPYELTLVRVNKWQLQFREDGRPSKHLELSFHLVRHVRLHLVEVRDHHRELVRGNGRGGLQQDGLKARLFVHLIVERVPDHAVVERVRDVDLHLSDRLHRRWYVCVMHCFTLI